MQNKRDPADLARRQRQILHALFRLGEASVADVRKSLPDPPSYSAVRAMLALLEAKGVVRYRREGKRYLYSPVQSRHTARASAVKHLLQTFFDGSVADAVAAMLKVSAERLTAEQIVRLEELIRQARKEGR